MQLGGRDVVHPISLWQWCPVVTPSLSEDLTDHICWPRFSGAGGLHADAFRLNQEKALLNAYSCIPPRYPLGIRTT